MRKLYLDMTETKECVSVFIKDAEVIPAGVAVNSMSVKYKNNEEYKRFANEYDIHFIFDDNVPNINFYTIPYIEIIAADSNGGYIAAVGNGGVSEDNPVCYIDRDLNSFLISDNLKNFLEEPVIWKTKLEPYNIIEFFNSKEDAKKKYDFLDMNAL